MDNPQKSFDFDKANLADQLTVVGLSEHLYEHCLKTASTIEEEEAVFYLTVADMTKEFRRKFMKEHFPEVREQDWCIIKACDALRQRVYESAHTSHEDLQSINNLWALVMEHIFEVDLSGCVACIEDRGENSEEEQEAPTPMEIQIENKPRIRFD